MVTKLPKDIIKASQNFWVLFLKGIGCNWLVCLSIWLAVASEDAAGKILSIVWEEFSHRGFSHKK